ncbi:MAG TPA: zinc ribbon domain-containing protein [Methylomirabilota bacterium]|nr:zinc ribbon domain-containing protein [Methylomirabilota bacterium]
MSSSARQLPASESPCGHTNGEDYRYCDECGTKLPMRCGRCRTMNRPHAKFCKYCGADLRDPSRGAQATGGLDQSAGAGAKRELAESAATANAEDLERGQASQQRSAMRDSNAARGEDQTLREAMPLEEPPLDETDELSDAARLEAIIAFSRRHAEQHEGPLAAAKRFVRRLSA